MLPHDDLFASFNRAADAALAADALSRHMLGAEAQEAFALVGPLARQALAIGRALVRGPVFASPQPHCQAGTASPAGDPQKPSLRPDRQPIPVSSSGETAPTGNLVPGQAHSAGPNITLHAAREAWERDWLTARLRDHRGNVTVCAEAIGMNRSALTRKLRELGVRISPIRAEKPQQFPVSN